MRSQRVYENNLALIPFIFLFSFKLILKLRKLEFRELIEEIDKEQKLLPSITNTESKNIVRISRKINRLFGIENCLQNSIIAFLILKKFGRNPRFLIGVKKTAEEIKSHSWIEEYEYPIMEPESIGVDFNIILEKN